MTTYPQAKRLTIILLALSTTCFMVLMGGWVAINSSVAKRELARILSHRLSRLAGYTINIHQISGRLPYEINIDRCDVADKKGLWLHLSHLKLEWDWERLIKGHIYVKQAVVDQAEVYRKPQPLIKGPRQGAQTQATHFLPHLTVERAEVENLVLFEAVVGEKARFNLIGKATTSSKIKLLTATFNAKRLDDGHPTKAQVFLSLNLKSQQVDVDTVFIETANGFAATALGLKDWGALKIHCRASGSFNNIAGKIEANADHFARAVFNVAYHWTQEGELSIKGNVYPHKQYLPPRISENMDDRLGVNAQIGLRSTQIRIQEIALKAAGLRLALTGEVDLKRRLLDTRFDLDLSAEDLSPPHGVRELDYNLRLHGDIRGPWNQPQGNIRLQAKKFRFQNIQLSGLLAKIHIKPLPPLASGVSGLRFDVQGNLDTIDVPNAPYLSTEDIAYRTGLTVSQMGEMTVHHFLAQANNRTLKLAGTMTPRTFSGDISGTLSLSDLRRLGDQEKRWPFTVATDLNWHFKTLDWRKSIEGQIDGRGELKYALYRRPSLLNTRHFTFGGDVNIEDEQTIALHGLFVNHPDLKLKADGLIEIPNEQFQANLQGTIPNIEKWLGTSGSLPAFSVHFNSTLKGNSAHIEGRLKANVRNAQQSLQVTSCGALAQGALNLDRVEFRLGENHIVGDKLQIDLRGASVLGQLQGDLDNLETVGGWIGSPLHGQATFNCVFRHGVRGPQMDLELKGKDLATQVARLKLLRVTAAVQDIFHHPSGSMEMAVHDLVHADLSLSQVQLSIKGSQRKMDVYFHAESNLLRQSELTFRGEGGLLKGRSHLTIKDFSGNIGSQAIRLLNPALIECERGVKLVNPIELAVGDGHWVAQGQLSSGRVGFNIRFNDIRLDNFNRLGWADMQGVLEGDLQISGSPHHPVVNLSLLGQQIRFLDRNLKDFPSADVRLSALLNHGRLETEVGLYGFYKQPMIAQLSLPVQFSITPWMFEIDRQKPVDGLVSATFEMEMISTFLLGKDQIATGHAETRLTIHGTVEHPLIEGALKIDNGQYEYLEYGTFLRGIEIEAVIDQSKLRVIKASATDGEGGTITIDGTLDLSPANDFPIYLQARINKLFVVRKDDFTCPGSGHLTLSGTWRQLRLEGNLITGSVEYVLEESAAASLDELEIIKVNRGDLLKGPPTIPSANTNSTTTIMQLDLDIDLPAQVYVRGMGIDSEWKGHLKISGTTDEPVIFGSLSAIRGNYQLILKPFKLTYGLITFYGASPPTPFLDITTEAQTENLRARLVISGNAESPVIELSSTPSLPTDEIISQLVFKQNAANITATQAIQLAAALQTLSGNRNNKLDFMGKTRSLLRLDQLELRQSQEGLKNTTVGFGKYLAPGIYLDVEETLGGELGKVSVEMDITPNISVEGETGPNAKSGVGLNYKFDY